MRLAPGSASNDSIAEHDSCRRLVPRAMHPFMARGATRMKAGYAHTCGVVSRPVRAGPSARQDQSDWEALRALRNMGGPVNLVEGFLVRNPFDGLSKSSNRIIRHQTRDQNRKASGARSVGAVV